jgi:hypothetical protein
VAKKKPLLTKEKKFFEGRGAGKSKRAAAIDAGYAASSASHMGTVITQKHSDLWDDLLNAQGLDNAKLAKTITDGTEATRVISAVHTDKEASGASCDFINVPDWMARHRYVDTALKLRDAFPASNVNLNGNIKVEVVQKTIAQIIEAIKRHVKDAETREKIARDIEAIGGNDAC